MLVMLGMIGCGVAGVLLHNLVMLAFVAGFAVTARLGLFQWPGRQTT